MAAPDGLRHIRAAVLAACDADAKAEDACHACQECLMLEINAQPWRNDLARKTQQYGAALYLFAQKRADRGAAPQMPTAIAVVAQILARASGEDAPVYEQCIVNKYEKGERITAHIDHIKHFGPRVATVSLGAPTTMRFKRGAAVYDVLLQPGDVVILEGDARWKWSHETFPQEAGPARVSITYRTMQ